MSKTNPNRTVALTFVQSDGARQLVEGVVGETVMDAALDNGVAGITAQCGGGCTCCTCHCYVAPPWLDTFAAQSADERDLLVYAWQPRDTSRLACQLDLTPAHDGLVIEVPLEQS